MFYQSLRINQLKGCLFFHELSIKRLCFRFEREGMIESVRDGFLIAQAFRHGAEKRKSSFIGPSSPTVVSSL